MERIAEVIRIAQLHSDPSYLLGYLSTLQASSFQLQDHLRVICTALDPYYIQVIRQVIRFPTSL
jgi:hypothetical protein